MNIVYRVDADDLIPKIIFTAENLTEAGIRVYRMVEEYHVDQKTTAFYSVADPGKLVFWCNPVEGGFGWEDAE